jgi:hypothetical protein
MLRRLSCFTLLLAGTVVAADTPADEAARQEATTASVAALTGDAKAKPARAASDGKAGSDAKTLSGMSILGNQEAPKALVIVPWKSSQLGDQVGLSKTLDDGRQPVDRDVFMRELEYYEIRAGEK